MKFISIRLKNYRCFQDSVIDFTLPKNAKNKNIILCSWENGGGKTNLMFAFRFALYGMTEKEYASIPGQEEMPYALNQNIYRELLQGGFVGEKREAEVELAFEFNNRIYTIRRTHIFTRGEQKITGPIERVALLVQDSNGDTSGPYLEPTEVRRRIERVIPEKTLYALLCDGERVRKLSSTGASTDLAIQSVIARMTEHELLNVIARGLEKVRRQVSRKLAHSTGNDEDKLVAVKIANLQKQIEDDERACRVCEDRINSNEEKLDAISQDLENIDAVKQLEIERLGEEKLLKTCEDNLAKAQKKFLETLNKQTYWAMSGKLCREVKKLMEDASLRFPGLEADIVEMVMKGDKCICGRTIDEHVRKYMAALRKQLPPFNVDAILSSVLHEFGTDDRRHDYQMQVAERQETINEIKGSINEINSAIAELRKRIESSQNPNAAELEHTRDKLEVEIGKYKIDNGIRKHTIMQNKCELSEQTKKLKDIAKHSAEGIAARAKLEYLESAEKGIVVIKKLSEEYALSLINKFLAEAFTSLRSKSDAQRQIYITQYEPQHRLVVYHEAQVKADFARCNAIGDKRKCESIILSNLTGNSMGQLKMASLAFMKAILSYVCEIARNNPEMVDAEYPVLMDAPLGDIRGDNYDNAVKYMHEFSEQVILLLADREIPPGIEPYVARRYSVQKLEAKKGQFNSSKIIKIS